LIALFARRVAPLLWPLSMLALVACSGGPPAPQPGTRAQAVLQMDAGTKLDGPQLNFVNAAHTITAGGCTGALTVQLQDSTGNPTTAPDGGVPIALATDSDAGSFYTASDCSGSPQTGFTIVGGTISVDLYYSDLRTGTPTLGAASSGYNSGYQTETVDPGPATHLTLDNMATAATVSAPFDFDVTARDQFENVATGYLGTVDISASPDTTASFAGSHTFTSGDSGQFHVSGSFDAAGTQTVTVQDSVNGFSISGPPVTVFANSTGTAVAFQVDFPVTPTAGVPAQVVVSAIDSNSQPVTAYSGTVQLSSSTDPQSSPIQVVIAPSDNGRVVTSFTFKTSGIQTLDAMDQVTTSITGSQSTTVSPGPAASFGFSGYSSPITAGTQQAYTVTAFDAFGNALSAYNGNVSIGSSDTSVAATTIQFNGSGQAVVNVTLTEAGDQTLTAVDQGNGVNGTSGPITVQPGPYAQLEVEGFPSPTLAGDLHTFTVIAADAFGNPVTSFNHTIRFSTNGGVTSSDVVPGDTTFSSPSQSFSAVLTVAGAGFIRVQDLNGSEVATQPVVVNPAAASQLDVSGFPSTTVAGVSHNVDVTALDPYGNIDTNFTGTVQIGSSDTNFGAPTPNPYTFTSGDGGRKSFSVKLKTVPVTGTQSITAATTSGTSIQGLEAGITVQPAAPERISINGPGTLRQNAPGTYAITLADSFGNPTTNFAGTMLLTCPNDPLFAVQSTSSSDPAHYSFSVTFGTIGTMNLTATDSLASTVTKSFPVTVTAGPPFIVHNAVASAGVGIPYAYNGAGRVQTTGGPPNSYSVCGGPAEFHVDATTGVISWTPTTTGPVNLCVAVSNDAGSDSYPFSVDVQTPQGAPPVANIAANLTPSNSTLHAQFDGIGSTSDPSTTIVLYRWDFGDGSAPAYAPAPAHDYALTGGYQVRLTVTDGYGRTGSAIHTLLAPHGSQKPPTAKIQADVLSGTGPLTVNFTCDCQAGDSPLKMKRWDLGPTSQQGLTTSYTFDPGVYNVHLTVTDEAGLTATDTVQIVVSNGTNTPPSCRLYGDAPAGVVPLDVTLSTDVRPGSAPITAASIQLFDGSTTSATSVYSPVTDPGRYFATLTVTDSNGESCSDVVEVTALATGGLVPPQIVSLAPAAGASCSSYEYDPVAAGSQPLSWNVSPGNTAVPAGLTIDAATGVIKLDPSPSLNGSVSVYLNVGNDAGGDSQLVELDVSACRLSADVGCRTGGADGLWLAPALLGLALLRRRRTA
jgi:MYXO-CTERM domain-containing protein